MYQAQWLTNRDKHLKKNFHSDLVTVPPTFAKQDFQDCRIVSQYQRDHAIELHNEGNAAILQT